MKKIGLLGLALALLLGMAGCGMFDKDDGKGKVHFKLNDSNNTSAPNINIPEDTTCFIMELIQEEPSDTDSSDDDSEDSSSEESEDKLLAAKETGASASLSDDDSSADDSDSDNDTDSSDDSTDGSNESLTSTCTTIPATYMASMDYTEGDTVDITIDDVAEGAWVVRVSALDENDKVLAHVQKAVTVGSGENVDVDGYLQSGSAPEGYIFFASVGDGLYRISLLSEKVEKMDIDYSPSYLFFMNGLIGSLNDKLYAITHNDKLLEMVPSLTYSTCDVNTHSIPDSSSRVVSGASVAISYPVEGGVRFYDLIEEDYTGLLSTGRGANEFSNVVNDCVWVSNEDAQDISKINLSTQKLMGSNISTGYVAAKLAQNDAGDRLWTIGTVPSSYLRVVDNNGNGIDHYTKQLVTPSSLLITNGEVCVGDSSRNEVVFFKEATKIEEIRRLPIAEGVADCLLSDGQRVYALTSSGDLAVIDLTTHEYNHVISMEYVTSVSIGCNSMVWMH